MEGGDSEDGMGNDWDFVRQEKLKASPNGGKEEHVIVHSAPNGGNAKWAKGK